MPKVETFNRDLVLNQAVEVFHDKGFNGTSMQDLVDATGLNRSSIYNSFENKLNIYLECLKRYEDRHNRETSKKLLESDNGLQAIKQIFYLYLKEIQLDKDERGCLIVNCKSEMANHEISITKFLQLNQRKMLTLFQDLVSRGQDDGSINKNQNPEEYALYLYSSIQGFRMTGILISNKTQLENIIYSVLQTVI